MKNLSLIAAIGSNRELGLNNNLIWKIPEDLQFYKNKTMDKNIIMGRKTFESMPVSAFKGRNPIVISSRKMDLYYDVISFDNLASVLNYIEKSNKEFIVVGGSTIYNQFLPYVDTMYLTEVLERSRADTFFPYFYEDEWEINTILDCSKEKPPYIRNKYVRRRTL